jgi:hypothetical protein
MLSCELPVASCQLSVVSERTMTETFLTVSKIRVFPYNIQIFETGISNFGACSKDID